MKRSRIICSIITVIYMLLLIALTVLFVKSNIFIKSSVPAYLKALYIAMFGTCIFMYVIVKNKLAKKMSNKTLSIKISKIYCYLYLAVIVFISRFVAAFVLKNDIVKEFSPSFNEGLGSYINYALGHIVNNQMYANVILNATLAFGACILIKKIILNITENDTVATIASIMYILLPQSLIYVTQYIRFNYNVILVLIGVFIFIKIIDEIKNFNKKSSKYIVYSIGLGLIQSLDIIIGGSYVLWFVTLVLAALEAIYIDIVHVRVGFKQKLNYKLKIFVEKLEKINISKLVYVSIISLLISGLTSLIYFALSSANNYLGFSIANGMNVLMHSRSYYLVIIIFSLVFEVVAMILNRKLDTKMFYIKTAMITTMCQTFFMSDGIYASAQFDTLLVLTAIINICNICYNREEKIKLLKDKN